MNIEYLMLHFEYCFFCFQISLTCDFSKSMENKKSKVLKSQHIILDLNNENFRTGI